MILKSHDMVLVKNNNFQSLELIKESSKRYEQLDRKIKYPIDVYTIMKEIGLDKSPKEKLYCMYLDKNKNLISNDLIHIGGVDSSLVQISSCLSPAILHDAKYLIIVHNHPTGYIKASEEDLETTKRLKKGCDLIGIELLDSVIIGDNYKSILSKIEY